MSGQGWDHPVRGRLNAAGLDLIDGLMHRVYGARKARLFADLGTRIVEVGPGVGANFRYYPAGTRVVAVEPNLRMHGRLEQRARAYGLTLELHPVSAEHIPLPDASEEVVVATLVLCSVGDPAAVVTEVHRILRPGGKFVFLEHVAAPGGTALRQLQRILRRPWRWAFEGCTLDRCTRDTVASAGFRDVRTDGFAVGRGALPVSPHLAGIAVR